MFFIERLHCTVQPDGDLDGYLLKPTAGTPLSMSSMRGVWSALRDFYRTMIDAGYYPHGQNPLESRLLTDLRKLRARTIRNRGAPDHAGIRGEALAESGRRPSAFFRSKRTAKWEVDGHCALPDIMFGLNRAVDRMLADRRLGLRDRCVIGLLRNTGARASEITDMTVGGYRSFTRGLIAGEAIVKNKGSYGAEVKPIYFHAAYELQDQLERYVRTERARLDLEGRTALADLPDDAPFFLTERRTPYNYGAFKWQWRRVYPEARKLCPVDFAPHDLRHLVVTELLVRARAVWGKDSPEYADSKATIAKLFGWAEPATIDVYDHSLNDVETLGLLDDWQRSIAARSRSGRATRQGVPLSGEQQIRGGAHSLAATSARAGVGPEDHSRNTGAVAGGRPLPGQTDGPKQATGKTSQGEAAEETGDSADDLIAWIRRSAGRMDGSPNGVGSSGSRCTS